MGRADRCGGRFASWPAYPLPVRGRGDHRAMNFTDTVTIAGTRETTDGYLVTDARVARSGIQIYLGSEVGKPEMSTVRVYRRADQVFATDAMAAYAHKPVTVNHPQDGVTAATWRKLAVGNLGDAVARDGEFVRVP